MKSLTHENCPSIIPDGARWVRTASGHWFVGLERDTEYAALRYADENDWCGPIQTALAEHILKGRIERIEIRTSTHVSGYDPVPIGMFGWSIRALTDQDNTHVYAGWAPDKSHPTGESRERVVMSKLERVHIEIPPTRWRHEF